MKKIIISRKGFDSSSGGCASPVLPDGRLRSLPIPECCGNVTECCNSVRYSDIYPNAKYQTGDIVESLTRCKCKDCGKSTINSGARAHLDPDIDNNSLPGRHQDWRGIFGQKGAALIHLEGQGVCPGDLFLFFGLFREAEETNGDTKKLKFRTGKPKHPNKEKHIIFGWLQIADIFHLPDDGSRLLRQYPWCTYHPHVENQDRYKTEEKKNAVYIAEEKLTIRGLEGISGYGVFQEPAPVLQLTAEEDNPNSNCSLWKLPKLFEKNLSYHKNAKWTKDGNIVRIKAVGRGQEFVADISDKDKSEVMEWLRAIFACANKGARS